MWRSAARRSLLTSVSAVFTSLRALRPPSASTPARRRLRRQLARHRRALAACFLAAGTATALVALTPPTTAPTTRPVVVAARDLAAGSTLATADLRILHVDPGAAAHGTFLEPAPLLGQVLVGDVRSLEQLTDVRLLRAPLVGGAQLVMTAVRLADADAARLLHAGDRVDVLAAAASDAVTADSGMVTVAVTVASGVRILAVPRPPGSAPGRDQGALVVLATTAREARALAGADASARLSVVVLH